MMEFGQILDYELKRGHCFKLLSELFYLPQKDVFIESNLLDSLSTSLRQVNSDAFEKCNKLVPALNEYTDQELKVEYTRLFIGPFKTIAPPYGSVFLEGGITMGETTVEVLNLYNTSGLSIEPGKKNLPDHIAVELEFMYYLVINELKQINDKDYKSVREIIDLQIYFCHNFLDNWIVQFCDKIIEGSDNLFYKALGECLKDFSQNYLPHKDLIKSMPEDQN